MTMMSKRANRSALLRAAASELHRMLRSPWFAGALALCLLLVAASALLNNMSYREWYGYALGNPSKGYGMESRFMVNYWVGTDRKPSSGALYFLLPILCLLPGAGSLVEERFSGYIQHALVRMHDCEYYVAKAIACFISAGLVALIPLCVSILLAAMIAPYGIPDPISYAFLAVPISHLTPFRELYFTAPMMFLLVWTGAAFLFSGLWAGAVLGASLFVASPVKLYLGAFAAQLLINYASMSLGKLLAHETSRSMDLFTLTVPTGYEEGITSLEAMAASIVLYLGCAVILPTLFFRRRCYLR